MRNNKQLRRMWECIVNVLSYLFTIHYCCWNWDWEGENLNKNVYFAGYSLDSCLQGDLCGNRSSRVCVSTIFEQQLHDLHDASEIVLHFVQMLTNTYDLETSDLRSHPVFTTANKFNIFFLLLVIPFCCVLLVRIHSTHTFTHSTNVYAQAVLLNCARATSSSETDDDSDNGGGGGSSSGCGEKKINNNTRFLVSLVKLNSKCVDVCIYCSSGCFLATLVLHKTYGHTKVQNKWIFHP